MDIVARTVPPLSAFQPATVPEIIKLMNKAPTKSCPLHPIPTWLLKRPSAYVAPSICYLFNLSLQSGVFPAQLKQAPVIPLLKKATMDPDTVSSHRPVFNLPYLSRIIERVVASRLTSYTYTSDFSLLPVQQSAYLHSTPQKPLFCASITISFVPSMSVTCVHLCCWISVDF